MHLMNKRMVFGKKTTKKQKSHSITTLIRRTPTLKQSIHTLNQ